MTVVNHVEIKTLPKICDQEIEFYDCLTGVRLCLLACRRARAKCRFHPEPDVTVRAAHGNLDHLPTQRRALGRDPDHASSLHTQRLR